MLVLDTWSFFLKQNSSSSLLHLFGLFAVVLPAVKSVLPVLDNRINSAATHCVSWGRTATNWGSEIADAGRVIPQAGRWAVTCEALVRTRCSLSYCLCRSSWLGGINSWLPGKPPVKAEWRRESAETVYNLQGCTQKSWDQHLFFLFIFLCVFFASPVTWQSSSSLPMSFWQLHFWDNWIYFVFWNRRTGSNLGNIYLYCYICLQM